MIKMIMYVFYKSDFLTKDNPQYTDQFFSCLTVLHNIYKTYHVNLGETFKEKSSIVYWYKYKSLNDQINMIRDIFCLDVH